MRRKDTGVSGNCIVDREPMAVNRESMAVDREPMAVDREPMAVDCYDSFLGRMLLASDEKGLTGVWIEGQKYYGSVLTKEVRQEETEYIRQAKEWLEQYFSGSCPDWCPALHLIGSDFRRMVWDILLQIPYGQTMTYGQIARKVAEKMGRPHMSAQAVGGAVGHNPISVIVPCHRVLGSDGSLTGYAGGISRKVSLLLMEQADISKTFLDVDGKRYAKA